MSDLNSVIAKLKERGETELVAMVQEVTAKGTMTTFTHGKHQYTMPTHLDHLAVHKAIHMALGYNHPSTIIVPGISQIHQLSTKVGLVPSPTGYGAPEVHKIHSKIHIHEYME